MDINNIDIKSFFLNHFKQQNKIPLIDYRTIKGYGIYALYYYKDLQYNKHNKNKPIYVGKAMPSGCRKGQLNKHKMTSLKTRLNDHFMSIKEASNLAPSDFELVIINDLDFYWLPAVEILLITEYQPVWNIEIDGFGNRKLGKNRLSQKVSKWDQLHPGRTL